MAYEVPIEVQRFVARYIRSFDQLEVLLVVSAAPEREWSTQAVYQIVLSNQTLVAKRLDEFVEAGLLTCYGEPPLYRFAPVNEELKSGVVTLDAAYKMSRHKIVELIYSQPTDPMKAFSDAFKLKRDK